MTDESPRPIGRLAGLSVRLIATIIFVILAVEVIIYLPSAANFRANWLDEKLAAANIATRVLDVVPDAMDLPDQLTDRLLSTAGSVAIVYRRAGQSQLLERTDLPMPTAAVTADMEKRDPFSLIAGTLDTLFLGSDRIVRILGPVPGMTDAQIEVLTSEAPLRSELLVYSRNIFVLSLIVALMTAVVIFVLVNRSVIRPIQRLVENMMAYRRAPENASLIIDPSPRNDEIGILERELSAMEADLFSMLRQRRHLADLGLAVAKINHDLRNTLTSAQLLSDQVATLEDPKVQRLAPRLVQTLDRAIGFAQSVLDYGRQSMAPPKPQPVDLRALVDETLRDAGLFHNPEIEVGNEVPDGVELRIDPDQMARVFTNLLKNAREALENPDRPTAEPRVVVAYRDADGGPCIAITDNGPGMPPRAREHLFVAFEGSARAGGTGLGLAIAREITEAHGGRLVYEPREPGTRFEVQLPPSARLSQTRA